MTDLRTCPKCERDWPASHFNKHKRQCKACRAETERAYVARNREKVYQRNKAWRDAGGRHTSNLAMYGITPEQYEALYEAQGGVCGTCFGACPTGKRLAVDHDHETGEVRGLLCSRCNPGLGYFQDNAERLRRAAEWIENGGIARAVLGSVTTV